MSFRKSSVISIAIIVLLLIGYFYSMSVVRVNVVWADDVDILRVLNKTQEASTLAQKFELLYLQHNPHRVLLTRGVFYFLQETIGLRMLHVMYLSDLFYLGILWLMYRLFIRLSLPLHYFLPIPVLFLGFVNVANSTWAMAAMQNIGIQLFVVGAIYSLATRRPFYQTLLWAVGASFTSLTGLLFWGLAIGYSLVKKRWKAAVLYLIAFLAVLSVYFWQYQDEVKPSYLTLIKAFPHNVYYMLVFLGQLFLVVWPQWLKRSFFLENVAFIVAMAGVIGLLIRYLYQYIRRKKFLADKPVAEAAILYSLFAGICAFMALVVTLDVENPFFKDKELFIPGRYIIHSLIFFSFLYLLALTQLGRQRWFYGASLVLAIVVYVGHYYYNTDRLLRRKQMAQAEYFHVSRYGQLYSHLIREGYYINCQCYDEIYRPLEARGADLFPNHNTFDSYLVAPKGIYTQPVTVSQEDIIYFKVLKIKGGENISHLILQNEKDAYVLPTYQQKHGVGTWLRTAAYWAPGRFASIYSSELREGTYQLYAIENGRSARLQLPYRVHISGPAHEVQVERE